jgi:hypothetical protein
VPSIGPGRGVPGHEHPSGRSRTMTGWRMRTSPS